ncbi:hypothetical protein BMS3Abin02_02012 [bacterium BMS3Abin02]|nr:hypothetical protein BMS3Abin02_02012 [bacterium BMS3Abin02]GBE22022.1 hypothetical protein BMS3Bbin01_01384 [bacterium BMS3Bbin01]
MHARRLLSDPGTIDTAGKTLAVGAHPSQIRHPSSMRTATRPSKPTYEQTSQVFPGNRGYLKSMFLRA